jgi:hypothetical protein
LSSEVEEHVVGNLMLWCYRLCDFKRAVWLHESSASSSVNAHLEWLVGRESERDAVQSHITKLQIEVS